MWGYSLMPRVGGRLKTKPALRVSLAKSVLFLSFVINQSYLLNWRHIRTRLSLQVLNVFSLGDRLVRVRYQLGLTLGPPQRHVAAVGLLHKRELWFLERYSCNKEKMLHVTPPQNTCFVGISQSLTVKYAEHDTQKMYSLATAKRINCQHK